MPVEYFIGVSIVLFLLLALVIRKWGLKGKKNDDSRVTVNLDPSEIELLSSSGKRDSGSEDGTGEGESEGDAVGDTVLPESMICPPGCQMKGSPPPEGDQVWFEDASGLRQGPFVQWEKGGVRREGRYVNGELSGTIVRYNKNGFVYENLIYENGDLNGQYEKRYYEGELMIRATYVDGKLHGEFVEYYRNGGVIRRANHFNGEFHGVSEMYSEDGVLLCSHTYHHGVLHGTALTYFDNGKLKGRDEYNMGIRSGRFEVYHENGTIAVISGFKDGILVGPQYLYYDDGSMMMEINVENNIPFGRCDLLSRDGGVLFECVIDPLSQMANIIKHDVAGDSSFAMPASEVIGYFYKYFEENGASH